MKRVFLHIGAPKTGTTFLQGILWRNRELLAQDGVLIPYVDERQHFRSARDFCGGGWRLLPAEHFTGEWAAVAAATRNWDGSTVIITNELLAGSDPDRISSGLAQLEPAEVHVIFTMRDLARQLVSDWQEHIKHLHTITLEGFVEALMTDGIHAQAPFGEMFWGLHDPLRVLPRWGESVPAERIHVVTGPRPGAAGGELWRRFASVVGLDPTGYDASARHANRSLGVNETELIRRMNLEVAEMPQNVYDPLVRQYLAREVLGSDSVRLALPPQFLGWATQRSHDMVMGLRTAGYSLSGDWADLIPRPEDHRPFVSPTTLTDRDLGGAALRAAVGLLQRAGEQRATLLELNSEITGQPLPTFTGPTWRARSRRRVNLVRREVVTRLRESRRPRPRADDADLL
ncbi:MAG: hypothetical protein U0R64_01305 [Candidatus Nanopelagicales bacterium]